MSVRQRILDSNAEMDAWMDIDASRFLPSERRYHRLGFEAGVNYARRTPGPETRNLIELFKALRSHRPLKLGEMINTKDIDAFLAEWEAPDGSQT